MKRQQVSINYENRSQKFHFSQDGEHPTTKFSVSAGDKIENFMTIKIKNNIKTIISLYHSKYFIAKFAFKKDKEASEAIIK